MSGDCEKCGEHALECKCEHFPLERKWITKEEALKYFPEVKNEDDSKTRHMDKK